ncbi:hypothetical protein JAAARDRAFT_28581 [Jaapia argillacea MUCL 33604]|uniref:Uncharacterized protein n=1 Tax=Jaapia argillacea MUCL 33604 TaxID=933084 RepID=A0A067QDC4_9AGAM|nr:hypothetical protein JAAARDRAFT_28581 [Jaapia argillacea MUCL 33604]
MAGIYGYSPNAAPNVVPITQYSPNPQPAYLPAQAAPVGYAQPQVQYAPQPGYASPQPPPVQYAPQPGPPQVGVAYAPPPSPQPQHAQVQQQITPGTITYTTSVGTDGRVVYHPFKAVAASYQTPQGIVNGIQWIPAEATQVLPAGATPATSDFAASWNRNPSESEKVRDWQREEDKRRKREEKEASKRVHQWEKDRRDRERAEDREQRELREARDRDAASRNRRKNSVSFSPAAPNIIGGRASPVPGYAGGGYGGGIRAPSPVPGGGIYGGAGRAPSPVPGGGIYGGAGRAPSPVPGGGIYGGAGRAPSPVPGGGIYGGSGRVPSPVPGGGIYGGVARSASPVPGGGIYGGAGRAPSPVPGGGIYGGQARGNASPIPGYAPGVYAGGVGADLERRFEDMSFEQHRSSSTVYSAERTRNMTHSAPPPQQDRRGSMYGTAGGGAGVYGAAPQSSSVTAPYPGTYPPSPSRPEAVLHGGYHNTGYSTSDARPSEAFRNPDRPSSPYPAHDMSISSRPGVYPPGHVLEGQPIRPPSRGPPVAPGGYPRSPNMRAGSVSGYDQPPSQQEGALGVPEGFGRPPNMAHPYTPFDIMRVLDLDEFLDGVMPRFPITLSTHDVYNEDWMRLMQDLSMAWSRRLPIPDVARTQQVPKRTAVAAEIVDTWNAMFFTPRGVEVVLYKGHERRSGANAGTVDHHLPGFDVNPADISTSESDSSNSDSEDEGYGYGEQGGVYGRQADPRQAEIRDAKRRRKDKKEEQKRKEKEKKLRRKVKEKEKAYTLYITSVEPRASPMAAGGYETTGW